MAAPGGLILPAGASHAPDQHGVACPPVGEKCAGGPSLGRIRRVTPSRLSGLPEWRAEGMPRSTGRVYRLRAAEEVVDTAYTREKTGRYDDEYHRTHAQRPIGVPAAS